MFFFVCFLNYLRLRASSYQGSLCWLNISKVNLLNTHSESYIAAIHDGVEKLGICGRLTDSPATGTGRFGTLGIWRFTFGRFTLGRLLVKLLQKKTDKKKKGSITVVWELQKAM